MKKKTLNYLFIIVTILFTGCDEDKNIKTIAFVSLSDVDDNTFAGFKIKMEELGWIENDNIKYTMAGAAKDVAYLPNKVKNIIAQNPDMILVSSTPATQEVKKQNKNIPVVFCPVNDPIGANIVQKTNKPEGLITGIRLPASDYKRTEWLYQIAPNIKNVFVPFTPDDQSSKLSIDSMKSVAKELGFSLIIKPFVEAKNIDQFIQSIPTNIDAIILPRDSIIESQVSKFVEYSLNKKIPLSVPSYQQVQKGALFTYGFIHKELGKDAALMANKILKGVKTMDIPIKFGNAYLVINESTAKKIGIPLSNELVNNAKLIVK